MRTVWRCIPDVAQRVGLADPTHNHHLARPKQLGYFFCKTFGSVKMFCSFVSSGCSSG